MPALCPECGKVIDLRRDRTLEVQELVPTADPEHGPSVLAHLDTCTDRLLASGEYELL